MGHNVKGDGPSGWVREGSESRRVELNPKEIQHMGPRVTCAVGLCHRVERHEDKALEQRAREGCVAVWGLPW